jgi:aspartate aminotransferase-like enzyme
MPNKVRHDYRPGFRVWSHLPALNDAPTLEEFNRLVQFAVDTAAPVYNLPSEASLCSWLGTWLRPLQPVLLLGPGGEMWYQRLNALNVRATRLTAAAIRNDLLRYLEGPREWIAVIVVASSANTATGLDVEELLYTVRQQSPNAVLVADVSHTLGLQPYYHDAWLADATVYARPQLATWVATQRWPVPPQLHSAPGFGLWPYLQAVQQRTKSDVWNATHHEAQAFRQALTELGAILATDLPISSNTGFYLPNTDAAAMAAQLQQNHQIRVGKGFTLHREAQLTVQHAPEGPNGLLPLITALRAMTE